MKRFLAAIIVLALMLPAGCGLQETAADAYPETWAFLQAAYGGLAGVDIDRNFVLHLPEGDVPFQPETPPEQGGARAEDVVLEVMSVEITAEIGYAVSYILDNPGDLCEMAFTRRVPTLYIWMDGLWWPVSVESKPDAELGVWMEQYGSGPFMKPMTAAGTGNPLPSVRYCLAMDLTEELGVTLRTEFDHTLSPDAGDPVGETMRDMYPETWRFFRSIYGDKFTLDEEGNFAYVIGKNQTVPKMPSPDIYLPYTEEDVTLELGSAETTSQFLSRVDLKHPVITTFILSNHSGKELKTTNDKLSLEVYLDGCWWWLETDSEALSAVRGWNMPPGDHVTYISMRAYITAIDFPDGRYRCVRTFYQEPLIGDPPTYLTLEFDYVYHG